MWLGNTPRDRMAARFAQEAVVAPVSPVGLAAVYRRRSRSIVRRSRVRKAMPLRRRCGRSFLEQCSGDSGGTTFMRRRRAPGGIRAAMLRSW
jgi:hypothetical protein